jgi:hypothetical protein
MPSSVRIILGTSSRLFCLWARPLCAGQAAILKADCTTLDHSAFWSMYASIEALRGKTGHVFKYARKRARSSGPTPSQSTVDSVLECGVASPGMAVKVRCTKLMFDRRVYAKAVQRRAKTCSWSKRLTRRGRAPSARLRDVDCALISSPLRAIPKFADKVDVVAVLHLQEPIEGAWRSSSDPCKAFFETQDWGFEELE